ncbi:MAG: 3-ketoacyl-ACP reductase [Planctomycetaceae bacterium]|jgi:NAD(P)-dependent dehydrogenase (short-subunit alcohol dehydrogenase family)|nr:3-ketoacyl-ACP reductase [Planctomycetaceae bacterium]
MKTALVTGGLRGIGLGISEALIGKNYSLALCGTRTKEEAGDALARLQSMTGSGQNVVYYSCDIGSSSSRQALLQSVRQDFPYINVLVNNAGVAPKERCDILDLKEENYAWLMKINLEGPFFLTQKIAQWMIATRKNSDTGSNAAAYRAVIINISSISAESVSVNRGEYCISKAGVSMAAKLWAVRLGEFGIPVYEIRPGIIQTDMTAGVSEKYTKMINEGLVPEKRWGYPDDAGRAVAMLAEGGLPYATGQVITLDGGLNIPRL